MYCNKSFICIEDWIKNKYVLSADSSFKILQLNIRGINDLAKFDSFKEILHRYGDRIDVIVLGETWIKAERVNLYEINGYNAIFSCRNDSHGGLAVFVRKELVVDVCRNTMIDGFHHIHCRFQSQGKPVNLHAVYRPPCFDVRRFLFEIENMISASNNNDRCILVGDTNIPINITSNNIVREYMRLLEAYNLVTTNTSVTRPSSNNVLDHVACTDSMTETLVNETAFTDLSDHCLICSSFNMTCHTSIKTLTKRIIDHSRLNHLFTQTITNLPQNATANEKLNYVINGYNAHLEECTKIVSAQAKLKGFCPWMSLDLWRLIRIKDNALKRKRKNPNDARAAELLTHVSRMLQDRKAKTKREYYERMLNGSNQKAAWRLIKDVTGKKGNHEQPVALREGAHIITDPQQICSRFNEYFCEVGPNLASTVNTNRNINRFRTLPSQQSSMFIRPTSIDEVIVLISKLDSKKSAGPDSIPVSFIKIHHEFFSSILVDVFNEVIYTGQFPDCLKIARVIPVYKSGDPKDMNNYRPISTLSIMDKILEKLIVSRIVEYTTHHRLIYSHQYGFRQGSSTLTACNELVEEIYEALDSKNIVGALFIDLKKAFDTVDHQLLIRKLDSYGIRGTVNKLLESYLTNRYQYVTIGDYNSPLCHISTGVPQGSNLGPILFLLFVNDVARLKLHGKLRLFADDTAVFYRGTDCDTICNQIKADLEVLLEFFGENVLSLNLTKTKFMLIHTPRRRIPIHIPVTIHGHDLEEVYEYEFLGLTIDATMSWSAHINSLKRKVSSLCGILRRIAPFMPQTCLKKMYFALVQSRLQYLVTSWGAASKSNLRELQVLQNRCLKVVLRKPFLYSTFRLYSNVDDSLLPIKALHELQILVQMQKIIKDPSLHHNTVLRRGNPSRVTRQAGNFVLIRPNTELGKKRFTYLGSKLYNALPENIKNIQSMQRFKTSVRAMLKLTPA